MRLSSRTWPAGGPAGRCASATARGTRASSTCTANCSTPRSGWPNSSANATPVTHQFLAAAADAAASRWNEKDQGIWEIRGEPRDFLYSKLMCRVALAAVAGGGMSLCPKFA
jgi:hypothetical protein